MDNDGPRRGTRDNGLRCANYTPVADLDPRIVDALLAALREEGIAAYAAPTPAATGGAMELRLPSRPIDRLWVDDSQVARAKDLVDRESAEQHAPEDIDFESAWQGVLASLHATPGPAAPSWPEEEPPAEIGESYDPADEDHFEPPAPPPLPRLRRATLGALAVMAFGVLLIVTNVDGGAFRIVGLLALLGGGASLVWNMRKGPPTDSGWDDGAVV
ncbi:MAG TPA: hypothetical protein VH274_04225 [Mycobacteriales bacterium]|jgi:hypothetical protein|nr:hypothetical protein [Mycobacteriales bacterium]